MVDYAVLTKRRSLKSSVKVERENKRRALDSSRMSVGLDQLERQERTRLTGPADTRKEVSFYW